MIRFLYIIFILINIAAAVTALVFAVDMKTDAGVIFMFSIAIVCIFTFAICVFTFPNEKPKEMQA